MERTRRWSVSTLQCDQTAWTQTARGYSQPDPLCAKPSPPNWSICQLYFPCCQRAIFFVSFNRVVSVAFFMSISQAAVVLGLFHSSVLFPFLLPRGPAILIPLCPLPQKRLL
ncbi:hypothetical protein M426DRAFT_94433 [Hypoxylon sp. CI-4A]|nr:hypothetical protein M426DRAFT_94433 [Hypoxylon sp. CI-4A]